jgi:RpiR family transcriptional regulator, carbohydrate utilization regulator
LRNFAATLKTSFENGQQMIQETSRSDLIQRIQAHYGSLRPAERIVADYLRNNAGTRLDASITEFARSLGVSEATISRVSRALGYDGFPSLKLSVAEEANRNYSYTNLPRELEETDPMITLSDKLSLTLANSLRETHLKLDADRLEKVVQAIAGAKMTVFVGVGGAASVCDEAVHMLLKAGIDAASYRDGYTQIVASATMDETRTIVGISHTGHTETVANALALARSKGAKTIAITSDPNSIVAKAAELQLITWHHSTPQIPLYGDFLEGRIAELYLVDLIYLGLLFHTGKTPKDNLKATGAALEKYYQRTDSSQNDE